jgi:branched-chain amino acid transport system permease protein
MVGAFLVSYIPDRFNFLGSQKYLVFGVALIVLMIFRPQGLLGARQRLLANGRTAYLRLIGRPEQLSSDSALAPEKGEEA